jgi:hypothetical protein
VNLALKSKFVDFVENMAKKEKLKKNIFVRFGQKIASKELIMAGS